MLLVKKTCSCGRERPTTHRSNNIQMAPHRYRGRRTYKTVHTRSGVEPFSFASRQQWLFARLSPHSAAIGHPTPPSCLMTTHLPPPISATSSPLMLTTLLHHPCPCSISSCLTQRINVAREARAAFGWDRDLPPPHARSNNIQMHPIATKVVGHMKLSTPAMVSSRFQFRATNSGQSGPFHLDGACTSLQNYCRLQPSERLGVVTTR